MGLRPDAEGGSECYRVSLKAKTQVEGGELEHFSFGKLSTEENVVRGPPLTI